MRPEPEGGVAWAWLDAWKKSESRKGAGSGRARGSGPQKREELSVGAGSHLGGLGLTQKSVSSRLGTDLNLRKDQVLNKPGVGVRMLWLNFSLIMVG